MAVKWILSFLYELSISCTLSAKIIRYLDDAIFKIINNTSMLHYLSHSESTWECSKLFLWIQSWSASSCEVSTPNQSPGWIWFAVYVASFSSHWSQQESPQRLSLQFLAPCKSLHHHNIQGSSLLTALTTFTYHRGICKQHSLSVSSSPLLAKYFVDCFGVFPTCLDKMAYVHYDLKENKKWHLLKTFKVQILVLNKNTSCFHSWILMMLIITSIIFTM